MSDNLPSPRAADDAQVGLPAGGEVGGDPFGHLSAEGPAEEGANFGRYLDALFRYKWIILAFVVLGTAAGVLFARRVRPTYVAQATIWIEEDAGPRQQQRGGDGLIQEDLLQSTAWVDLLKSWAVLDYVVIEQGLYLDYGSVADSAAFRGFALEERFRPGAYELVVAEDGGRFELKADGGIVVDSGAPGDSIGDEVGFKWAPQASALGRDRTIVFAVQTPRDASNGLRDRIVTELPEEYGNFLQLSIAGVNANRITATLNAVANRFIEVATELKRAKLDQLTAILEEQLAHAESTMNAAEMELEAFRVQTITLPSEATPITPGLEATQDPAFEGFFAMRIEREQLRRDAEAIRSALAQLQAGNAMPVDQLWTIESVEQSADLRQALEDLTEKQAELRAMQSRFTDEHPEVRRLMGEVQTLERSTVPALASGLATQLDQRELTLAGRINTASSELRQIPPRMIEEARLERRVTIAEALFTTVQSRYESARLAAVSSIPDVRILDAATVPNRPTNPGAKPKAIAIALFGSLAAGIALAILLDRLDRRVRYPTQITNGMGLPILGAIQLAPTDAVPGSDATEQVVEAFRELRLAVMAAYGNAGPLMLTVTSPGSGDGKSFVSSNLALAFADLGYRTLLIDGDIRRGTLHNVLGGTRKPGLTDFLAGEIPEAAAIQRTEYPNVDFIGAGAWRRTGPELLASPNMRALLANVRSTYKVIIVDSSPLGAGVDPYVLGTVTGSLLMVLRTGATDRDLAGAKLDTLQRLPIRVLGAVLNAVPSRGMYRYYSYLSNYQLPPGHEDREPADAASV